MSPASRPNFFLRLRAKVADRVIAREQDDDEFRRGLEIGKIAVQPFEFAIPADHLLVDGRQLLISGLELFLGGFQFLVETLQLLVGRLALLVGRLELLVGGLLLLLDGLEIIARIGEIAFQADDLADFFLLTEAGDRLQGHRPRAVARLIEQHQKAGLLQIF